MAILAVALTGAAISWYFRYKATHRAAEFWGPKAARLIRDATHIELFKLAPSTRTDTSDTTLKLRGEIYAIVAPAEVSAARGMTHLRNALLEDVSFDAFGLGSEQVPPHYWRWVLYFRDNTDGQSVSVLFSDDCSRATLKNGNGATADCEPIAKGLREMFDEFISAP